MALKNGRLFHDWSIERAKTPRARVSHTLRFSYVSCRTHDADQLTSNCSQSEPAGGSDSRELSLIVRVWGVLEGLEGLFSMVPAEGQGRSRLS